MDDRLKEDKRLLIRIAEGDEAAFTALYNIYSIRITTYVAAILNADLWAEEIVQDVFVKLWDIRHTLAAVNSPAAFIYRMAANRTWDHLKRQSLEVKLQYRIARRTENNAKNFTEEQLDFHFSEQLFREAVNELPAQRRQVYRLKQEEGLSYAEIASKLGISKNTVRNQIVSALQAIRGYMVKKGGLPSFFLFSFTITMFLYKNNYYYFLLA